MAKLNCVNLDKVLEEFGQLEQNITELTGKNSLLEVMLDDSNRLQKFYQNKEKNQTEVKDSLLVTVNQLQHTLQEQCHLRADNERLKSDLSSLREENERRVEVREAEFQQLLGNMRAEQERHQRELESVRQQCRREAEDTHKEGLQQMEAKDAEMKSLLEEKDRYLEEMRIKLKDQERARQSELLTLQMEFGAKLARVQTTAQWTQQQQQQQQQGSHLLPQSIFKRKLQFFQEEKNKEIGALRQRIRELEENQLASSFSNSRLKRRKL